MPLQKLLNDVEDLLAQCDRARFAILLVTLGRPPHHFCTFRREAGLEVGPGEPEGLAN